MNKAILCGRLTKDVETRYTQEQMAISRFSIAVDRKTKDKETDFINIVAFGKNGEFAEKYLKKGTKVIIEGRIQTGSYEKDGKKVYTTDIVAESFEFAESKKEEPKDADGFMNIPEGIVNDLPFARP